ncbi:hypothetical protein ScPMuIL_008834 [Solemya velum]
MGNAMGRRPSLSYVEMSVPRGAVTCYTPQQTVISVPLQPNGQGSSMSYEASTGLVQGSPYSSTPPPPYAALPQPYTCPPNVNYSQQQMATVSPYCGTGQPQTAVSYTKEGQWEGKCQTIIIPSAQQGYWYQRGPHNRKIVIICAILVSLAIMTVIILFIAMWYS